MREEVRAPRLEPQKLAAAEQMAHEIYCRYEAGAEYDSVVQRLAELTGQSITKSDPSGAVGSVDSATWARDLFLAGQPPVSDLSDKELLELLCAICKAEGEEWQMSWWLRCVEASTGSADVSDLIFYPKHVLGPADGREELTPEEILAEAKRRPRRVLITPPPRSGAA